MKRRVRPKRLFLTILLLYACAVAALGLMQQHLLYLPQSGPSDPAKAGLPNFTRKTLSAPELPIIIYWENAPSAKAITVLYFHGNGGGLFLHAEPLAAIDKAGLHVVAMEYPSYPGAEGKPSEKTIIAQALQLEAMARKANGGAPIIWGYSLGSGVATQVAAERTPQALILEAPFTATVDRAAELFPLAPVALLMRDQYRSRDYISRVKAPIFIMHGDADRIIPIQHGRDLFAVAPEPKTFKEYAGYGHLDLVNSSAYEDAFAFIRNVTKP